MRCDGEEIGTTTLQIAQATLTAGLLQLQGLMDTRPELLYIRYEPFVYAAEIPFDPYPYPELLPALRRVCSCESTGNAHDTPRQFNSDGSVVHGRINDLDRGMCQINLYWHGKEAKALGINLNTVAGNIAFANHLYQRDGLKPWSASQKCWQVTTGDK